MLRNDISDSLEESPGRADTPIFLYDIISFQMKEYYVYIMANKSRTLYTGVTNDLLRRVYEHKHKLIGGFTKKYNITRLVYFDSTDDVTAAIAKEKQIKGMLRIKKIELIKTINPLMEDLSEGWYENE